MKKMENKTKDANNYYTPFYVEYELPNWIIKIEEYPHKKNTYVGFACTKPYAKHLEYYNASEHHEILIKKGFEVKIDKDDYSYFEGLEYFIAEPDDVVVYHINNVNTKSVESIVNYLLELILDTYPQQEKKGVVIRK